MIGRGREDDVLRLHDEVSQRLVELGAMRARDVHPSPAAAVEIRNERLVLADEDLAFDHRAVAHDEMYAPRMRLADAGEGRGGHRLVMVRDASRRDKVAPPAAAHTWQSRRSHSP